ncbi:hypothetical protein [Streptomyces cylindrosporus]
MEKKYVRYGYEPPRNFVRVRRARTYDTKLDVRDVEREPALRP